VFVNILDCQYYRQETSKMLHCFRSNETAVMSNYIKPLTSGLLISNGM
jgi:hypothetical protein